MNLRKPQLDCLKGFHEVFLDFPKKMQDCVQDEIRNIFYSHFPSWSYEGYCPEMTCALATGVGKTRLMGAIMAYLYRGKESNNFVILAPRVTIIDKLIRESQISHPKYIFVNSNLVRQPFVYHSRNIENYDILFEDQKEIPRLWIISPQAIARSKGEVSLHFRRRSEYLGMSPFDYLASLKDLVVFFDESHHLGNERDDAVSIWMRALRELKPKMVFEMTASPKPSANIIHEYSLIQCLNEGLYTKAVQAIVRPRPEGLDDTEWDRTTLRFAIDRLNVKNNAIKNACAEEPQNIPPNPVMLVCAADKNHAEEVAEWLKQEYGSDEAVLLVHSGLSEEKFLAPLLAVERPDSKVRAIVNVFKLTEGWDVTNVYIIVPLRALATVTGVLQTMGRGLRLPFGKRIGVDEVDTLDVLCFGRETLHEVVDKVLQSGFGDREENERYIDILGDDEVDTSPTISQPFKMVPLREIKIEIPRVELDRPNIDLSKLRVPPSQARDVSAIDISDPNTIKSLKGNIGFDHDSFVAIVSNIVLRKKTILGGITDYAAIIASVERFISDAGVNDSELIKLEPELVAIKIIDAIDRIIERQKASFVPGKGSTVIEIGSFEIRVPEHFKGIIPNNQLNFENWNRQEHKGLPVGAWNRCIFESVPFDTPTELHVGKILDRSDEIEWWIRNLRPVLSLATPIGMYSPDFLFLLRISGINVILEIKGEFLAAGFGSDATTKAIAAEAWCEAISEISNDKWEHWFVLDRDARRLNTFSELKEVADEWRSFRDLGV
jgi:superfamily II DNA or RNA helicase